MSLLLAALEISLVRVSIRVPFHGLTLAYFLSFILSNSFHISLAVLLRYRSPHVFSLGCPYHPFILHYQAILLLLCSRGRGLSPPLATRSRVFSRCAHNFALPLELLLVRSPLLKKSMFVSSPVLSDMLKSRTCSCIAASFQPHCVRRVYRVRHVGHRLGNLSILYAR